MTGILNSAPSNKLSIQMVLLPSTNIHFYWTYKTITFKDAPQQQQQQKSETWFSLNLVYNDADKHSILSTAFRQQKHRGQSSRIKNLCILQKARNVSRGFSFPVLRRVNHHRGSNTDKENRGGGVGADRREAGNWSWCFQRCRPLLCCVSEEDSPVKWGR